MSDIHTEMNKFIAEFEQISKAIYTDPILPKELVAKHLDTYYLRVWSGEFILDTLIESVLISQNVEYLACILTPLYPDKQYYCSFRKFKNAKAGYVVITPKESKESNHGNN